MTRARSASKRSRSPSPATIQRLPSACVTARCLKDVLASPASSSACSSPPGVSWAMPLPSNTPMATVSAWVSVGAEVVEETCIRRGRLRQYDADMPKTVILGSARTPIGKLGGGLSTLKATELGGIAISAALERSEHRSRAGRPRRDGPGAPGRPGADPLAPGPDRRRDPEGGQLGDDQQGLRLRPARHVILDQAIRAGDVEVGVGGGMESMSQAPYLLPQARFGYRMGDAKALDAMVHDGLTNPFSGRQMFDEATEIGDELELTRPDLDRWALRSHELALAAIDDGRMADEIVTVTVKGREGRHRGRGRRGAAPRLVARGAGEAAGPRRQGGLAHRRQLAGRQRRRRRAGRQLGRVGAGERQGGAGRGRRARAERQRLRLPRDDARLARRRRRSTRPGCRPPTSISGRSTRRSPP